jgi:RNA polymerase sigma factor (TIGR02999 family)
MTESDPGVAGTRAVVARLLDEVVGGNRAATEELFALLYDELRGLARRQRRRWRGDDTLNTTALLHEAYVKLVGRTRLGVESRAHFLGLAARAMRHILCNYARRRGTRKRGGGIAVLPLEESHTSAVPAVFAEDRADGLVALDDALQRLERLAPRQSRVVICRFFGELTVEETAAALGVSARTVQRDWTLAQAWLHRELTPP